MAETFLFDGVDVQTVASISSWEGQFTPPGLRGTDLTFPTANGEWAAARPYSTGVFTLPLVLLSTSLTGRNDQIRSLLGLIKPGKVVTCTRRRDFTAGTEDHTASVRYLSGLESAFVETEVLAAALSFSVLDGLWYGSAVTIGAGSSTVKGEAATRRMTVTISGGSSPKTVTNSTNGWALTYTGSTATAVVIDVENMTATQGASDVSGNLTWTKDFPMQLEAGSNTLTISSGTLSIAYSPAYL